MAPPKADLNQKETQPEVVPETIVVDKELSPLPKRTCERRRRRCRVGIVLVVVALVIVVVALPIVFMHRHRHRHEFDHWCGTKDIKVPEHVRINYEKKLIFVNNSKLHDFSMIHGLHDFENKFSAFRDTEHKKCFINKLSQGFEDAVERWDRDEDEEHEFEHGRKHGRPENKGHFGKRTMMYTTHDMEKELAENLFGQNVADHCQGHQFHIMKKIRVAPPKKEFNLIVKIPSVDALHIIYVHFKQN